MKIIEKGLQRESLSERQNRLTSETQVEVLNLNETITVKLKLGMKL